MKPPIASVRLIGPAGDSATVASAAAQYAFPSALVTRTDALEEIAAPPATAQREVLVLLSPTTADLERAVAALDVRGGPRWAIVACTVDPLPPESHALYVTPEDWTEPTLELALTTAARLQAFKADQVQLRGDLRTVGRRLAHDFRSPLNSIAASTDAMLEPDERPGSPRSEFARSISDSVEDIVRLFERISFILKATSIPPPTQPVIVEEIVWGALQRLESRMKKIGATIKQPAQWPIIEGVPAWYDVIFTNLITNSLVHAGPAPEIELGWEQVPEGYRFWVRDQGVGVPAKQAGLLFFPLDRLSELNAPRGLGLPIVRRLVELLGGRCGYEPAVNGGSGTFYFIVPAAPVSGES